MADKPKVRVVADGDAYELPASYDDRQSMAREIADALGVPWEAVVIEEITRTGMGAELLVTLSAPEVDPLTSDVAFGGVEYPDGTRTTTGGTP